MAVATRLLSGTFDTAAPRRTVAIGVVGLGLAMGLLALAAGPILVLVGAALGGAAHGVVFPVLSSEVVSRARTSERGSAVATFTSVFDLAILGLVPVVGFAIDVSGYPTAFGAVSVSMLIGSAIYVRWDIHRSAVPLEAGLVGDSSV
jgi:predicted MFS family arabinose efflux permease